MKKWAGPDHWTIYEDFRRMIAKEKLDAVMVETTTHARAWVTILAMQAGMDVYIEKPMCLTVAEGRRMVQWARKLGRVTQVGTQQRSLPQNNWASDLVKNGAIGKVLRVLAPNFIGPQRWTKTSAKDLKGPVAPWWDVWTNQAELRPWDKDLQWGGWKPWWDFDGGGLSFGVTGYGTHSYDQVNRALGTDNTGPAEVVLEEPLAVRSADTGLEPPAGGYTGDVDTGGESREGLAKLVGPRAKVRMKFAGGTELLLHLDCHRGPGLGAVFVGEKGKIEINRDRLASNPKEIVRAKDNPGTCRCGDGQTLQSDWKTLPHLQNWVECIKSRRPCNADIEFGQRATTLCLLVNIARQLGQVGERLHWDPVAERFTNSQAANALLHRPRRKGYELPEV